MFQSEFGQESPVETEPEPEQSGTNRKMVLAAGAGTAVLLAAGGAGFLLLSGGADDEALPPITAKAKPTASASATGPVSGAVGGYDLPTTVETIQNVELNGRNPFKPLLSNASGGGAAANGGATGSTSSNPTSGATSPSGSSSTNNPTNPPVTVGTPVVTTDLTGVVGERGPVGPQGPQGESGQDGQNASLAVTYLGHVESDPAAGLFLLDIGDSNPWRYSASTSTDGKFNPVGAVPAGVKTQTPASWMKLVSFDDTNQVALVQIGDAAPYKLKLHESYTMF